MEKKLQELCVSDVMCVYSGRAGKCCCGCAGKHYANPSHLEAATADRGYGYDPEEVSAAMTTKVLRLVQAHEAEVEVSDANGFVDHVAVVVGKRLYVAYILPGTKVSL